MAHVAPGHKVQLRFILITHGLVNIDDELIGKTWKSEALAYHERGRAGGQILGSTKMSREEKK